MKLLSIELALLAICTRPTELKNNQVTCPDGGELKHPMLPMAVKALCAQRLVDTRICLGGKTLLLITEAGRKVLFTNTCYDGATGAYEKSIQYETERARKFIEEKMKTLTSVNRIKGAPQCQPGSQP